MAAFGAPSTTAVVTWKPQLSTVMKPPNTALVFDSSKIPGEIMDLMVVNTATLKANPKLGKALVGAWYETMAVMFKGDAAMKTARTAMAKASGTDLADFESQLATTKMFITATEAHAFMNSEGVLKNMDLVRKFSFAHGLLGDGAKSVDAVGIELPNGKLLGNAKNIKMRFDNSYTKLAIEGKL